MAASLGLKPKNAASNKSISSNIAPTLICLGSLRTLGSIPVEITSSSVNLEIVSAPSRRFCQNSSKSLAFGFLAILFS